ncbi:3-methyl-2-oxobutanoate hydroxymethyltransferase [PVC group bacterium]|nr:3-methyl-2-oxobutanoate hydroxymethyltransferase [PVC group bacterium]
MTIREIQSKKKHKKKISAVTAYDYYTAYYASCAHIDILLVGDSLGMVVLGYSSTLPVTVEDMVHHSRAVERGANGPLLVVDMPFMSYQTSPADAVKNAGRLIKDGSMQAVKLEGAKGIGRKIKAILNAGIPVMGHLGVLPQSVHKDSGYRAKGKSSHEAGKLMDDARYLEDLGVFAIVLECVAERVSKKITETIRIPSIGIGSGKWCDGQILVSHDLLGISNSKRPRFVKQFAKVGDTMLNSFKKYRSEVLRGKYPTRKHSY